MVYSSGKWTRPKGRYANGAERERAGWRRGLIHGTFYKTTMAHYHQRTAKSNGHARDNGQSNDKDKCAHLSPPPQPSIHTRPSLQNPAYVANDGSACFHCKTELYSTLEAVAAFAGENNQRSQNETGPGAGPGGDTPALEAVALGELQGVVLFNGTNAEDRTDPTRVGLRAAANFGVASPLRDINKGQV